MADFPGLPAFVGSLAASTPVAIGDGIFARETTLGALAEYFATQNGNSTPVAEWNGENVDQFDVDQTLPSPGYGVGLITNPAFVETNGAIVYTADAMAPNAFGVFWMEGEYDLTDIESIQMFIGMPIPTLGDEFVVGLVFAGDQVTNNAITIVTGYDSLGAPLFLMQRNDAPGGAQIISGAVGGSGYLVLHLKGERPVAAVPPNLLLRWEHIDFAGARVDGVLTTGYIESLAPWTASWNTAACNKVGIIVQTGAAGVANPVMV
jgi:hypothetical protein